MYSELLIINFLATDVRPGTGNVVPSTSQPSQEQPPNSRTAFPVAPSLLNRFFAISLCLPF